MDYRSLQRANPSVTLGRLQNAAPFTIRPPLHNPLTTATMPKGRLGSARVAILTIVPAEFGAVKDAFSLHTNITGTPYFSAQASPSGKHPVVLKQASGRTNVPAQQASEDIFEDYRPDFLFLVGTAGGMTDRDGLHLGDVVVPDYVHYAEMQKLVEGKTHRRYLPYDHPSMYLLESFVQPLTFDNRWAPSSEQGESKALVGSVVAGEKVWGDPTSHEQQELLKHFSDALAVDMESMGVARSVFSRRRNLSYNAQYLVVRGVSDLVDAPSNDEMRQEWRSYAAGAAAAFARSLAECVHSSLYGAPL